MNQKVLSTIKSLKEKLQAEGFIIDGIFGSYARGEANAESDIDILYHLDDNFYKKHSGFIGFKRLDAITKRHGGIVKTLEDFEGQMALLMGLSQIGETLKKFDDKTVQKYNLEADRDGAYYTRNYIVHDYEGVDLGFIENILCVYLPELKEKLLNITFED